jgi:hypothetical protein
MTPNSQLDVFSLKYMAASLFATYFSGVMHPLDLIKTRFQSKPFITQATTAAPATQIWCPNTPESATPSEPYTKTRDFGDFTKAFIFPSFAKEPPCPSSSGSSPLPMQL